MPSLKVSAIIRAKDVFTETTFSSQGTPRELPRSETPSGVAHWRHRSCGQGQSIAPFRGLALLVEVSTYQGVSEEVERQFGRRRGTGRGLYQQCMSA